MDRARDELLAGAGLALNQHRGVGRRDGLHLLEDALQRCALPDDLLEVVFGADFVFEVELLLVQLILQLLDLPIGQRVLNRDRDLVGHLAQQVDIVLAKRARTKAGDADRPQQPIM